MSVFEAQERVTIADIVEMTPLDLDSWLSAYGSRYTDEVKAEVLSYVAAWPDLRDKNILSITPTNTNFGVNLRGGIAIENVRASVRRLLEMPAPCRSDIHRLVRA